MRLNCAGQFYFDYITNRSKPGNRLLLFALSLQVA